MIQILLAALIGCVLSLNAFAQEPAPVEEWKPKMEWSGDLRFRLVELKEDDDDARRYQQLRARLGLRADVNPNAQAVLRLTTATSAISGNQTLGDSKEPGMPRRNFGVDLGYIDMKIFEGARLWLGRTANPFWSPAKVQTLFDSDLAFEGLALRWERKGDWSFFADAGAFMISENYDSTAQEDSVDSGLVSAEVGATTQGTDWSATARIGNHNFLNLKNKSIARTEKLDTTLSKNLDPYSAPFLSYRGNRVFADVPLTPTAYFFENEFVLWQAGAEFKIKTGELETLTYAEWIRNEGAPDKDSALEAGVNVKWSKLLAGYAWVQKERDSVLGAFTDSDTGRGGTDHRGHRLVLGYQIDKNLNFLATHWITERGIDTTKRDFNGTMLDLMASF